MSQNVLYAAVFMGSAICCVAALIAWRQRAMRGRVQCLLPIPPSSNGRKPERNKSPGHSAPSDPFAKFTDGPIHGTVTSIDQAYKRARKHVELCSKARLRDAYDEAEQHLAAAMAEGGIELRGDHWYMSYIFHERACIAYGRGEYMKARDFWEQAQNIASEWPDKASNVIPVIEKSLSDTTKMLGF